MHPSISINTLCFAPAPLNEHFETVKRLGARGVSPDLEQVASFGVGETAKALRETGLAVAALTHRAFAFATPDEARQGRERLNRTLGVAQEIGAESVIMTTGGRGDLSWDEAMNHFAEAVAPCAQAARAAGIRLGIEPTSHLYVDASLVHRLADAVTVARQADIAVMIDLFACWFDSDIDNAIAEAVPLSPLVQVSDYVYGDRGLPCRAVPGDGAARLDRLIPAIRSAGFTGWFDLEVIGPRLEREGAEAGLLRSATYVESLLG